jgi:NADH:ubiquinone oxidoreductase subunit F (NADH-binding)
MQDIIEKIKKAGLRGRGGAGFLTGEKWSAVAEALAQKKKKEGKDAKAYVVCNGSEGEPEVLKDSYILENYPAEVVDGIKIAMEALGAQEAFLVLRHDLFEKHEKALAEIIGQAPIKLFKKRGSYLAGEESVMLESIEGAERIEPRSKPPYPTTSGLWGCPTLVNNVETFYAVSLIAKDEYKQERFFTLAGDLPYPGVYSFPEEYSMEKVLHQTKNFPTEDFFVQAGGGASGKIFLQNELEQTGCGMGAIVVHFFSKTEPRALMQKWVNFFAEKNCGKCVPCREGVYRLQEILTREEIDYATLKEILHNLRESSFCPLGKVVAVPLESFLEKVLQK